MKSSSPATLDAATPHKRQPSSNPHEARVAILGFGTVGSSVARILCERTGTGLRLTHVYNRNVQRKRAGWVAADVTWTENIQDVLASDVDIVVEVAGGLKPAGDWVRDALNAGKSVVTANKQLIAHHGLELIGLARQRKRHIAFGASVAGGVPVISGLQEGLAGDELSKIFGILNGTCNYILSQIEGTGASFADALAAAQKLGFAEADPSEDVDGLDARAKLAILARVALRSNVEPSAIACHTIRTIDTVDFDYAKQLNCTIRQISWAQLERDHLYAAVQPALVALTSPLARVEGARNLVMSTGKFGGETVFGGHGAGGNPTAVAIVSDLVAIARAGKTASDLDQLPEISPKVSPDFVTRHYLRFTVKDRPGIIATLATIFSKCGINIDSVFQKPGYLKSSLPFVITLEPCTSTQIEQARGMIAELDFLVQPCLSLPIMD